MFGLNLILLKLYKNDNIMKPQLTTFVLIYPKIWLQIMFWLIEPFILPDK
jgi:hypothetical protein